jgi:agmatine/peptidylarginine deiminase
MSPKEDSDWVHVKPDSRDGLDKIAKTLTHAQRVIVIVGAGITTAAGIPVSYDPFSRA